MHLPPRLQRAQRLAQLPHLPRRLLQQRRAQQRGARSAMRLAAQPMHEPPVTLPLRRPALAAMHATDRAPAHRRLATGPVIVLAPRLAARRQRQVAAPVAAAQRRDTGHGVNAAG